MSSTKASFSDLCLAVNCDAVLVMWSPSGHCSVARFSPDSEKANTSTHAAPTPCQNDWRDGCDKTATWRVGCGPDVRFYCDSHEGPPCGGVFIGDFVITPDTTREELAGVARCGAHRIYSVSGRDVHDLRCCACGEWIGDTRDPAPVAGAKLCKAWPKISLPTVTPRIPQLGSTSWP